MSTRPIVLTIAGSDSSGGAGIQADLKTFTVLGVYGATVITALTAQNTTGVKSVHPVPADFVAKQFDAVTTDLDVAAIKIGMLGTKDVADVLGRCLAQTPIPNIVLDPVMIATSGDPLIDNDAIDTLKTRLIPFATVITPNRAEAAKLTDTPPFKTVDEMQHQARSLLKLGCRAVLIKGGHADTDTAIDCLVTADESKTFERPRINTKNTHGTGCTLSSAIAANLAQGLALDKAVAVAKDYVWQALNAARDNTIGTGAGPIDHMFAQHLKKS